MGLWDNNYPSSWDRIWTSVAAETDPIFLWWSSNRLLAVNLLNCGIASAGRFWKPTTTIRQTSEIMYYLSFAWFLLNVDSRCIRTIHWVDYFISCVIYTLLMTILIHMTIVTLAMSQLCDEQPWWRLMNYAENKKHELYTVSNSVKMIWTCDYMIIPRSVVIASQLLTIAPAQNNKNTESSESPIQKFLKNTTCNII